MKMCPKSKILDVGEEFIPEETTLKCISDSHAAKAVTSQGRF